MLPLTNDGVSVRGPSKGPRELPKPSSSTDLHNQLLSASPTRSWPSGARLLFRKTFHELPTNDNSWLPGASNISSQSGLNPRDRHGPGNGSDTA
eukprot:3001895-Pyramimonas_sp.AAC.1